MVEPDPTKAKLLYLIADEADRGVLVTAERPDTRPVTIYETDVGAKENPPA